MLKLLAMAGVAGGMFVTAAYAQMHPTQDEMSDTCSAYAEANYNPDSGTVSVASSNGQSAPGFFLFRVDFQVGGVAKNYRCMIDEDTNSVASFDG